MSDEGPTFNSEESLAQFQSGQIYDPNSGEPIDLETYRDMEYDAIVEDIDYRGEEVYGESWDGGIRDHVMALFDAGFIIPSDQGMDPDTRMLAREEFFEYMEWETNDFDWDTWRDMYGAAA